MGYRHISRHASLQKPYAGVNYMIGESELIRQAENWFIKRGSCHHLRVSHMAFLLALVSALAHQFHKSSCIILVSVACL